ncbi:FKBP-type peptidyl-prolyl cis-trans isomerase [Leptospira biflexa]|jgi:FKBP-type peptidyl-prolyl cis-trans isomerase|uniref:Peptidyl-prolyl cis-trans isomerase n=1 Tax=Leptospira biflexa serovar Patoc (strain Patoc 1 / ATCC 23582 / Paris) TaxID=456481 RepID=B0SR33_LEPBP|nr:FKBP-type peptidyl-prolyl cis-trans isomerase [Leptospira biflexa serovar Patoc strain 'Patoc 1 (Ames)']ABZ97734.1 FK506-binding protein [Leptospira biflexa serovar Patoc strain 'Patoc 1 (Paris)']TGM34397.1 FKBP-type peptidyl-prolyl cis-trans isomerase [Leptospira biflexa]TGM39949.1 FKBP-type peptidyl-prolyl cis-trans isomerase [Leptospira biflexa]TGM48458.1 FKBP-type peptidyl-prolyl cis-trans isomerase [Leptospira biflexa]
MKRMKQLFLTLSFFFFVTGLSAEELLIQDTKQGLGKEAIRGTTVVVHYTGKLTNGKVFDSSVDRGEPFSFQLGQGQVIQGWERGIMGMKEGGKRKLTIPPKYGYGDRAVGPIPANSTLVFDVELIKVK